MDAVHQSGISPNHGHDAVPEGDGFPVWEIGVVKTSVLLKTAPECLPGEQPIFRALRLAEECGDVGAMWIMLERRRAKIAASGDPALLIGLQVWTERTEAAAERELAAGGPGSLLDPGHRINQIVDRMLARRGLQREHGYDRLT